MIKKLGIFALLLVCVFSINGCKNKEHPAFIKELLADKSGNVLRLGFYGCPEEINPIKAAETEYDRIISNLVFASPLRKTDDGKYIPYLFESFETRIEGEHLVVNAKWRKNLKWHDGVLFKPSEYDYTISQMTKKDYNSPYFDSARGIVSINNSSDNLEIVFNENSIKYLDILCAGILPEHILSESKIASGTTIEETYNNFIKKPVGLGPFKVTSNENDYKYIVLEPNLDFYDGKGLKRPKIAVVCSYELQQNLSDFRENLFDWISAPSMIEEQLKNLVTDDIIYNEYPNPAVMTWVFNTKNPKLENVKIRKALNLIIDRSIIKQSFGNDLIEYFDNLIPVSEKNKSAKDKVSEAIKLFDESGLKDINNDGYRDLNGNTFELKILLNNDSMSRKKIAERMIKQLQEYGIKAEIQTVTWSEFISEKLKKGDFDTALLSYHISGNCSMKSLFSTQNPNDSNNLNFSRINDSELDKALVILDSAVTNEDKAKAKNVVNSKLSELCPCAFLVRPSNLALTHGSPSKTLGAKTSLWDDIFNWKLMFGKEDSKL